MKKILFLLLTMSAAYVNALGQNKYAVKLHSFMKLQKTQKDDWFEIEKITCDKKNRLFKKHHDEWADYTAHMINNWHADSSVSNKQKQKTFRKKLDEAVALYKTHRAEWKKYNAQMQALCADTLQKHEKQFAAFEESIQ